MTDPREISRRTLIQGGAALAALGATRIARADALIAQPPAGFNPVNVPGKVVKVAAKGDFKASMQPNQLWPKADVARRLFEKAMMEFTGAANLTEAMKRF